MAPNPELIKLLEEYSKQYNYCDIDQDWAIKDSFYEAIPKEFRHIFSGCIGVMMYHTTKELGGWVLTFGKPDGINAEIYIRVNKNDKCQIQT